MIKNRESRKYLLAFLLFILIGFIVYGNSLSNGFIIDDHTVIESNDLIKDPASFSRIYLRSYLCPAYYRPIVTHTFAIDYLIWKLNPLGYHLTNIFLHCLTAFLFFVFLNLLFRDFALSFISSLLFMIHPINNVSVNYLSDRGNILVVFFMLAALITFCMGYMQNKPRLYFFAALSFIISLFCRENAVLFPLYLLCTALVLRKEGRARDLRTAFIAAVLISAINLAIRSKYFSFLGGGIFSFPDLLSMAGINSFLYIITRYVSLIFWPRDISFFYRFPQIDQPWLLVLYILPLVFCLAFLFPKFRRNGTILFSLAWFLAGVIPLYTLMFGRRLIGLFVAQDSWIYFSSMGLFILLAYFLLSLKKIVNSKLWLILIFSILFSYAHNTFINNFLWKDGKTYCAYWLRQVPDNHFAHSFLSKHYVKSKEYKKALYHINKMIDIFVDRGAEYTQLSSVYTQLADLFYKQGKEPEAIEYFNIASKIDPANATACFNLGTIYSNRNNDKEAILYYEKVLAVDPLHFGSNYNLAIIYSNMGEEAKALERAEAALQVDPNCFK
ncbi:MAG: tetratricopeptide repeat protein [Candidatus Omnitrophota bacterium]